ncbi:hypothetical protein [Paracoccus sediminicola]|nr:hypothetical protein [Paracoccus sediminicola]WBU55971.1 hypothetical protein PAF18_10720 [Paracoccus sediminicola]
MTRYWLAAVLLLSACGVDGPPERPEPPGLRVSGEATLGVRVNDL